MRAAIGIGTSLATALVAPLAALVLLAGITLATHGVPNVAVGGDADSPSTAAEAYGKLPLTFVPNKGQVDRQVRFVGQTGGASFYFTNHEAAVTLTKGDKGQAMALRFVGANPSAAVEAGHRATGRVSYLVGEAASHRSNLATYSNVVYRDLWPGIDMVFKGARGQLEYEFVVAPGADPKNIQLAWAGATGLSVDHAGRLRIGTSVGPLTDARPHSFQRIDGGKIAVPSSFALDRGRSHSYGFEIGSYDRRRPLVIDPSLAYSTYLGGSSGDFGNEIAVDAQGNAYIAGTAGSLDYPTTLGAYDQVPNGGQDVFVTKLNPAGSSLVYSTYIGGLMGDTTFGLAVDGQGNAYVAGITQSTNFPATAGAYDTSSNGGGDGFLAKLSSSGSALTYATYLGGTATDATYDVTVDSSQNAYVTGYTDSTNFPTSVGAYDTTANGNSDVFAAKLSSDGTGLTYSTYLGGSDADYSSGIALDGQGGAYIVGDTGSSDYPTSAGAYDTTWNNSQDGFVTKLPADGSSLAYSTFVGGTSSDAAHGVAVNGNGDAYVTGETLSTNFPTTAGAYSTSNSGVYDAFVSKLDSTGASLDASTYLGGSTSDVGNAIAIDNRGAAFLTGFTVAGNFPTSADAYDSNPNGNQDVFVSLLAPDLSALPYSTYLGGSASDVGQSIAVDAQGGTYIAGDTASGNFPTTAGAYDTSSNSNGDAFVSKLQFTGTLVVKEDSLPDDQQDFSFTAGGLSPSSFSLDDDADDTLSNTRTFANVPVGSGYSVSQSGVRGWSPSSATCDDGSPLSNIGVSAAETVTCTFVNRMPYSRPNGGTPLRVPLVPAFDECASPDSTHGGGLPDDRSCKDPGTSSSTAVVGTSTTLGTRVGYARADVCLTNTAPGCTSLSAAQVPDVRLSGNGSDVVCKSGASALACPGGPGSDYDPDPSAGPYTAGLDPGVNSNKDAPTPICVPDPPNPLDCAAGADMTAIATIPDSDATERSIRVTDAFNDTPSASDLPECASSTSCSGTVRDQGFPVPVVCNANGAGGIGSYCGVNTTANALVPGVVDSGKAAVVEVGELQVFDAGPDGTRGNSDDELFAVQGVFVP